MISFMGFELCEATYTTAHSIDLVERSTLQISNPQGFYFKELEYRSLILNKRFLFNLKIISTIFCVLCCVKLAKVVQNFGSP